MTQHDKHLPLAPPVNLKIIKVSAINFELKSKTVQDAIIDSFANLLNSLVHPIQIICDSQIIDPDNWKLKVHDEDYSEFLKELIESKKIVEKTFYVVMTLEDTEELEIASENLERQLKNCRLQTEFISPNEPELIPYLKPGFVKLGDYYYETLIVKDWPYSVMAGWLGQIYNMERNIAISSFITPIENDKAIDHLQRKIAKFGSNVINKSESDDYYGENDEIISGAANMLDEVVKNEGKFMFVSYYITIKNKSYSQLLKDVKYVKTTLKGMMIKTKHSFLRQDDGLRCSLPHGVDYLGARYNFTTTPFKHFFPFISSNIMDRNGIMIGRNLLNGGLIFLDHYSYFTSSMIVLGKSGSGKSFAVKAQIPKMIYQGIEVTVFDTENEFARLKDNDKLRINNDLKIVKLDTLQEYKDYLKGYLRKVNESYQNYLEYLNGDKSIEHDYRPRFLIIDEFWRFMKDPEMAIIIQDIAKAGRKRWLGLCPITQEVKDLLSTDEGRSVLNACSIKMLLKQEDHDKEMIQKTFGLTNREWSVLSGTDEEGVGILFAGSKQAQFKTLVSDEQYKWCTTKPQDLIMY